MSFSTESINDVLERVAALLKRAPSDEELLAAQAAGVWNPLSPAYDVAEADDLARFLRKHAPRTEIAEEPGDWPEHSASVLENFREEQRDALECFGLDAPLTLAEVAPFLTKRAETEPAVGDLLSMTVPSERGWAESGIQYFRGYFQDEWLREMRTCGEAASAEEYLERRRAANDWAVTRANPLYHFARIVEDFVETTEISEVAAIAFLLADAPVRIPRLAFQHRMRWGGKNPGTTITLTVYDLGVKPAEVEWAYRYVRSELLRDEVVFPFPARGPRQRVRTMSDRTRELLSFCRFRKGKQKFPQILKEWNAAAPEWKYDSPNSLRTAYEAAERRWGIPKKKPDEP